MAAKHQEDQAAMKEKILDIPTKDGKTWLPFRPEMFDPDRNCDGS